MSAVVGFGLAQLKEEGTTSVWDDDLGAYRAMTLTELSVYQARMQAESAFFRTFRGRLRKFSRRVARAWNGLWDDGF